MIRKAKRIGRRGIPKELKSNSEIDVILLTGSSDLWAGQLYILRNGTDATTIRTAGVPVGRTIPIKSQSTFLDQAAGDLLSLDFTDASGEGTDVLTGTVTSANSGEVIGTAKTGNALKATADKTGVWTFDILIILPKGVYHSFPDYANIGEIEFL